MSSFARANRWIVPLGLVALALAVRLYRIDAHGIWFDEAHSLHMAQLSLVDMVAATAKDIHPPLYYLLLKVWLAFAGNSEFALRYLSVLTGILAVAVGFALGRRLAGWWAGAGTAAALALSPLSFYYSQETRMYALAATLVAAAGYFAWRAVELAPPRRWLPGYVVASSLAIYDHFYGLLPFFAFNLAYLLLALLPLWRRSGLRTSSHAAAWWAGAQLAVLAIFSPWLLVLRDKGVVFLASDSGNLLNVIVTAVTTGFPLGPTMPPGGQEWLTAALWLLAGCGVLWPLGRALRAGWAKAPAGAALFVVIWMLVSLALLYLTLAGRRDFALRYTIVALPAFALALGLGIGGLARLRGFLALPAVALLAVGLVLAVGSDYEDPTAPRPDFRGAIAKFEELARPNDAVVQNAYYNQYVFDYYYQGNIPSLGLPATEPPDKKVTEQALANLTAGRDRLWVFYWQDYFADPQRIVENWADSNLLRFYEQAFLGWVQLKGYEVRRPGETVFGNTIRLETYEFPVTPLKPGSQVTLGLHWRCLAAPGKDYHVFVHLVDDDYKFYAQSDGPPDQGKSPTSVWSPGNLIMEQRTLEIPAEAAGKELVLRVGLYDFASGQRLRTGLGDDLILARIKVAAQ